MKKLILNSIIVTGITLLASNTIYAESGIHQYLRQHDYQSQAAFIEPENKEKFDNSVLANTYFWEEYNKGLSNKKVEQPDTFNASAHADTFFWGFYNNPDQY